MKKLFAFLILSTAPLLASDNLTIQQQEDEINRHIRRVPKKEEIANIEIDIFTKINTNWNYTDKKNGKKRSIESKNWDIVELKNFGLTLYYAGENSVNDYVNALQELPNSKAILECKIATQVVRILTLKAIMGENSFKNYLLWMRDACGSLEKTFNSPGFLTILAYHPNLVKKEMLFESIGSNEEIGAFVYLSNIPDYFDFEEGEYQGYNLACVGDNKYMGFGDFFKNGPKSREEIYDDFYENLKNIKKFFKKYKNKTVFLEAIEKNNSKNKMNVRFKYEEIN